MEQKKKVWDQFFRDDTSNMLEDALPYLPLYLKKTAAIYIKLMELTHISREFNKEETLSACGLDQENGSMELLLQAMKLRAPKETATQIDQLLQMMQMMKLYQTYQSFINANPNLASSSPDNDMLSKLMPLLMSGQNQGPPEKSSGNKDFMEQLNQILNK